MNPAKSISPLISAFDLKLLMKNAEKFLNTYRVLDANIGYEAKNDYLRCHIKNALYFDAEHCIKQDIPHGVPNKECFKDYVGQMGISNDHHIIVYDRSPFGFFEAPRLWWVFKYFGHEKVSVLNGGMNKWISDIAILTSGVPDHKRENFMVRENKSLLVTLNHLLENLKSGNSTVVDVRSPEDFKGLTKPELSSKSGHIPQSKSLPYSELFDEMKGCLKEKEELEKLFENITTEKDKHIIVTGTGSITPCTLMLAAHLIGFKNMSLYIGSWTEYSKHESNKVETN